MKKLFTCACVLMAFGAHSQITLNQSSFTGTYTGVDTVKWLDETQPYPNLAPAANGTWNLTTHNYASGYVDRYNMPISSPSFPGGQFYDSMFYHISSGLGYSIGMVKGIDANGYNIIGERVFHHNINLGAVTMNPDDSLVFLAQDITYSSPNRVIEFPATMNSRWSNNYGFTTNFTATIAMAGLTNEPCQRKVMVTSTDTVIGWGQLRVDDRDGNPSANINVLMVRHMRATMDSFFINGAPAPVMLLQAFGLSQGMTDITYEDRFYRAGEVTPVVNVLYTDNSYTAASIDFVDVHTNRLPQPTSISSVTRYGKVTMYPNPLTGNTVTLSVTDNTVRNLQYDVMNINGQVIAKGTAAMNGGKGTITLDAAKSAGIYYIRLYDAGQLLTTLPLNVN